jgi:hypothetical protein
MRKLICLTLAIALFCAYGCKDSNKQKLSEYLSGFEDLKFPVHSIEGKIESDSDLKEIDSLYLGLFIDTTNRTVRNSENETLVMKYYYSGKIINPNKNFDLLFIFENNGQFNKEFPAIYKLYTISKEGKVISSIPFCYEIYEPNSQQIIFDGTLNDSLSLEITERIASEEYQNEYENISTKKYKINDVGAIVLSETIIHEKEKIAVPGILYKGTIGNKEMLMYLVSENGKYYGKYFITGSSEEYMIDNYSQKEQFDQYSSRGDTGKLKLKITPDEISGTLHSEGKIKNIKLAKSDKSYPDLKPASFLKMVKNREFFSFLIGLAEFELPFNSSFVMLNDIKPESDYVIIPNDDGDFAENHYSYGFAFATDQFVGVIFYKFQVDVAAMQTRQLERCFLRTFNFSGEEISTQELEQTYSFVDSNDELTESIEKTALIGKDLKIEIKTKKKSKETKMIEKVTIENYTISDSGEIK